MVGYDGCLLGLFGGVVPCKVNDHIAYGLVYSLPLCLDETLDIRFRARCGEVASPTTRLAGPGPIGRHVRLLPLAASLGSKGGGNDGVLLELGRFETHPVDVVAVLLLPRLRPPVLPVPLLAPAIVRRVTCLGLSKVQDGQHVVAWAAMLFREAAFG